MTERWLAPAQAAAYINVRPDALPRLVKQGRVPCGRAGASHAAGIMPADAREAAGAGG